MLCGRSCARLYGALECHSDMALFFGEEDTVGCDNVRRLLKPKPFWSLAMVLDSNTVGWGWFVRRDVALGFSFQGDSLSLAFWRLWLLMALERCEGVHAAATLVSWPAWAAPPGEWDCRVVSRVLQDVGVDVSVSGEDGHVHKWGAPPCSRVSMILLTRGEDRFVEYYVNELLQKTTYRPLELVIVSSGSLVPAVAAAARDNGCEVVCVDDPIPYGVSAAMAAGVAAASGDIVVFVHDDVLVDQGDWLHGLVVMAGLPGIGAVGPVTLSHGGQLLHSGGCVCLDPYRHYLLEGTELESRNVFGICGHHQPVHFVPGGVLAVRKSLVEAAGLSKRAYHYHYGFESLSLTLCELGYENVSCGWSHIRHGTSLTLAGLRDHMDFDRWLVDLKAFIPGMAPHMHPWWNGDCRSPAIRDANAADTAALIELAVDQAAAACLVQPLDPFSDEEVAGVCGERGLVFEPPALAELVAGLDVAGATAHVLALLRTTPALRTRFPKALSSGVDGPFFQWLADTYLVERDAVHLAGVFRTVFEASPGDEIWLLFRRNPLLMNRYPLGLSIYGVRGFLQWLVEFGVPHFGVAPMSIWWFLIRMHEEPLMGLIECYVLKEHWQDQFPDALLDESQWHDLARWLVASYPCCAPILELPSPQECYPEWCSILDGSRAGDDGAFDPSREMVTVHAYFSITSGLRHAALQTVEALKMSGRNVACRDVIQLDGDHVSRSLALAPELGDVSIVHVAPGYDLSLHCMVASCALRRDQLRVALWYWELEFIPDGWHRIAAQYDAIWAPSSFLADVYRTHFKDVPVRHLQSGILEPVTSDRSRASYGIPEGRWVCTFVFDIGSSLERKNPMGVVDAFRIAFGSNARDAVLVLKTVRGDAFPEELERLRQAIESIGGVLINEVLPWPDVNRLIQLSDCYASLHCAEGLGLTLLEAMRLGTPAVATRYSGNMDFMTDANSRLVDWVPQKVGFSYQGYEVNETTWANPSLEHAAEQLRWVFENRAEAEAMARRAAKDVAPYFSMEAYAERLSHELEWLRQRRSRGPVASAG